MDTSKFNKPVVAYISPFGELIAELKLKLVEWTLDGTVVWINDTISLYFCCDIGDISIKSDLRTFGVVYVNGNVAGKFKITDSSLHDAFNTRNIEIIRGLLK